VKYAFVAEHRPLFSVRAMCRSLHVQPSGFYAWLKNPLSNREREDARQTELLRKAWKDSGKVYGYRKLHDDLLDQGETCCPNRVARLVNLAAKTQHLQSEGACHAVNYAAQKGCMKSGLAESVLRPAQRRPRSAKGTKGPCTGRVPDRGSCRGPSERTHGSL
jgi:hypothetical protein